MTTSLFNKYFDDPRKSYIYTNLTCNKPDISELSFDINGSEGQITNNDKILSSIDLSDVNVSMYQYTNDVKIIDPHSYIYVKGVSLGDTYTLKSFGEITDDIVIDGWMNRISLFFVIKYIDINTGMRVVKSLKVKSTQQKTFIDVCNEYFINEEIPVSISYSDGFITYKSTKIGYEFWLDHVMIWKSGTDVDVVDLVNQWMFANNHYYDYAWDDTVSEQYVTKDVYSSSILRSDYYRLYNLMRSLNTDFNVVITDNSIIKKYLFEDINKYVCSKKYRNGAMLGCVVKVTYPVYNNEDIDVYHRSIKIAHIVDRIQEFYAIPESLTEGMFVAVRKLIDVVDSYKPEYVHNICDTWFNFCSGILDSSNNIGGDSSTSYDSFANEMYKHIEDIECIGIDEYCTYLTNSNNWMNIGQFYAKTTVADDESVPEDRNLIPSFIIYNPNNFPVSVNYLTFG